MQIFLQILLVLVQNSQKWFNNTLYTIKGSRKAAFDDSFSLTRGIMVRAWARKRMRKRQGFNSLLLT